MPSNFFLTGEEPRFDAGLVQTLSCGQADAKLMALLSRAPLREDLWQPQESKEHM
jgi:hypothetical protein